MPDTPDDIDEIIANVLNGDVERYAFIVKIFDKYLYKIGRSYGFDHQTTEDLMQETFVNAYIHLKDFERRSTFKTWISKIMLHQCYYKKNRSKFRRERSLGETENENEVFQPVFGTPVGKPEKMTSNNELKENIEKAIVNIPEDYRIVFTLRELNGLSIRETALALGLTESNVKVRLSRAKGLLRTELRKTYQPEEIFEFNLIYCDGLVKRVMEAIKNLDTNAIHFSRTETK